MYSVANSLIQINSTFLSEKGFTIYNIRNDKIASVIE